MVEYRREDSSLTEDVSDSSQAQRSSPLPQIVEVLHTRKQRGRAVLCSFAGPWVPTAGDVIRRLLQIELISKLGVPG